MLKTLGGLSLQGSSFTRAKPLLLLTYLSIEGVASRRELADLFFMNTKNPRDSLSTALKQLRKENSELLRFDKNGIVSSVSCDAKILLSKLNQEAYKEAIDEYQGLF